MKKIFITLIILTSFACANYRKGLIYYKRAFYRSGMSPIVFLKNLNNPSPSELRKYFNNIKKLKIMLKKPYLQEAKKEIKEIYKASNGNSVKAANYIMSMYNMLGINIFYSKEEKKNWNIVKIKFIKMKMHWVNNIDWRYIKAHKADILDFLIGIENGRIPPGL